MGWSDEPARPFLQDSHNGSASAFQADSEGSIPLSCSIILKNIIVFNAIIFIWAYSSAGRAPALQAGGQRFDPA